MSKSLLKQARLTSLAFCFLSGYSFAQPTVVDFNVQEASSGDAAENNSAAPVVTPITSPGYSEPGTDSVGAANNGNSSTAPVAPSASTASSSGSASELFYQLQILQEEVMQLRGQLEEQSVELQRLKQQRLDDYLQMDRRLSSLEQSGVNATAATPASSAAPTVTFGADGSMTATVPATGNGNGSSAAAASTEEPVQDYGDSDKKAYRAAYDLIKSRQLDDAELAFERFLVDYQGSPYCANAYYWLGELYDRKGESEKARMAFINVLEQFPDSNKVPDAMYKLGKVYHQLGNNAKSQEYLNSLIAKYGNTSRTAVKQARDYLRKNFSGNG